MGPDKLTMCEACFSGSEKIIQSLVISSSNGVDFIYLACEAYEGEGTGSMVLNGKAKE